MPRADTAEALYVQNRVSMPTAKGSAEISAGIPEAIRTRAFFSARVAEAHILDRLRQVSDDYSSGKIGRQEAVTLLRDFLGAERDANGNPVYDLKKKGLANLASHSRLNLIVRQNERMAKAVGEYERMFDPEIMEAFPYVIYHASVDSKVPRPSHQKYDGLIFSKKDPWLIAHYPPWDFGCNCRLEDCTARRAGRTPQLIQPVTPAGQVTVDRNSGFSFDPRNGFEEFDMASLKDIDTRRRVYRDMASLAKQNGTEMMFLAAPAKPVPVCAEPDNLDEIKRVLGAVKQAVDEHKPDTPYEFPEISCSLGHIAKERFDAIGMQPEDDVEVVFESPGKSDYGMKHWKDHHIDDWKQPDFVDELLKMLGKTIWNPLASMANTLSQVGKRIRVVSPDGKYVANLWRRGDKWVYSIQDAWEWDKSQAPSKKN